LELGSFPPDSIIDFTDFLFFFESVLSTEEPYINPPI